jgi:hypothetical protein
VPDIILAANSLQAAIRAMIPRPGNCPARTTSCWICCPHHARRCCWASVRNLRGRSAEVGRLAIRCLHRLLVLRFHRTLLVVLGLDTTLPVVRYLPHVPRLFFDPVIWRQHGYEPLQLRTELTRLRSSALTRSFFWSKTRGYVPTRGWLFLRLRLRFLSCLSLSRRVVRMAAVTVATRLFQSVTLQYECAPWQPAILVPPAGVYIPRGRARPGFWTRTDPLRPNMCPRCNLGPFRAQRGVRQHQTAQWDRGPPRRCQPP